MTRTTKTLAATGAALALVAGASVPATAAERGPMNWLYADTYVCKIFPVFC